MLHAERMKKILLLAVFLAPALSFATALGVHVGSRHDAPGFRDSNPGVYIVFSGGGTFGAVRNSIGRQSFYAGMNWKKEISNKIDISVTVGGITGYQNPVTPMIVPSVAFQVVPSVRLRSALLLNARKGGANAIHFMIERDLK